MYFHIEHVFVLKHIKKCYFLAVWYQIPFLIYLSGRWKMNIYINRKNLTSLCVVQRKRSAYFSSFIWKFLQFDRLDIFRNWLYWASLWYCYCMLLLTTLQDVLECMYWQINLQYNEKDQAFLSLQWHDVKRDMKEIHHFKRVSLLNSWNQDIFTFFKWLGRTLGHTVWNRDCPG